IPTSLIYSLLFHVTPTTDIYTLSLHDALPISRLLHSEPRQVLRRKVHSAALGILAHVAQDVGQLERDPTLLGQRQRVLRIEAERSEEHTSELQSHLNLVCRLLLDKKTQLHEIS